MSQSHAQRRFGRVNWLGLYTLIRREVMRFLTVWMQTLLAPLVTSGLFLLIFTILSAATVAKVAVKVLDKLKPKFPPTIDVTFTIFGFAII